MDEVQRGSAARGLTPGIVIRGALRGLIAFLAYEAIEFLLACLVPIVLSSGLVPGNVFSAKTFSPWDWQMTAILFVAYPILGFVLGGICATVIGLIRGSMEDFHYRLSGTLALPLTFLVHLFSDTRRTDSEKLTMGIALFIAALLVAAAFSEAWERRAGFLSSPWTVSLLLLVAPWISQDLLFEAPTTKRLLFSLPGIAVVFVAGALLYRFFPPGSSWVRALAGAVAVLLLFMGTVWLLSKRGPSAAAMAAPAPSGKPNILLITMDAVRADHLSLYGYRRETTPNLKKLAAGATVYTRAVAAADMTLPSHASILTGLYPSWHHATYAPPMWPLGRPLDNKFTTMAEVLRSKGYFTGAVVANIGYLAPSMNLTQGFASYDVQGPLTTCNWKKDFYLRYSIQQLLPRITQCESITQKGEEINREALSMLDGVPAGRPFFLFMNYMDAHSPYLPPKPFDTLFRGKDNKLTFLRLRAAWGDLMVQKRTLTPAEENHITSQYDGGIAYEDSEIGKLIGELKRRGLYDNTLIIVTADHGEAIGDHGLLEHAVSSLYQDQIHVPLVIKYPGQREGQTTDTLVSHVDLMPTTLDLLGYPAPAHLAGRVITKPAPPDLVVYSESYPKTNLIPLNPARFEGIKRAIYSDGLKLITWTRGPAELYDIPDDPGETRNLCALQQQTYGALKMQITSWTKLIPSAPAEFGKKPARANLDNLRSLGYVQ